MQEFLLLIHGSGYKDESKEALKVHMERYANWMNDLLEKNKYIRGNRLDESGNFLINRDTVVSDGPFLEPKEIIGGYILLQAENLEEATRYARTCPLSDEFQISIRPMYTLPPQHEINN